jgi:hypothetical protein
MAMGGDWVRRATRVLAVLLAVAAVACFALLVYVRHIPAPGDISSALSHNPGAYKLSLGHMEDLTLDSFAYLRLPLLVAGIAFLIGLVGALLKSMQRAFLIVAVMMVVFFHAAHTAMVVFDPFLSSRPIAEAILRAPYGQLITNHHYYPYSSVAFYTNRPELLLNGNIKNLEYGSNAPDAPNVFLDDSQFKALWLGPERCYFVAAESEMPPFDDLVGEARLHVMMRSGGKVLVTNQPLSGS